MRATVAIQLHNVREMGVIPLQPRPLDKLGTAELIHRDCFVTDTQVTLGQVFSTFEDSSRILGERLTKMMCSDTIFPMQIRLLPKPNKISLISGGKKQVVKNFDLSDVTTPPMTRFNLDFAFVEMLTLPPIDDVYSMNTVTGADAAVFIPLGGAATIDALMSSKKVHMNPFSAAIIRSQMHIHLRGAYAMLIRPRVA